MTIDQIIDAVIRHYSQKGHYTFMNSESDHYGDKIIGDRNYIGVTFYQTSLILDASFISSISGKLTHADNTKYSNLYLANRGQGIDNCRIIAHLCTWGEYDSSNFFAKVPK